MKQNEKKTKTKTKRLPLPLLSLFHLSHTLSLSPPDQTIRETTKRKNKYGT
jgi:hypothetical protein